MSVERLNGRFVLRTRRWWHWLLTPMFTAVKILLIMAGIFLKIGAFISFLMWLDSNGGGFNINGYGFFISFCVMLLGVAFCTKGMLYIKHMRTRYR